MVYRTHPLSREAQVDESDSDDNPPRTAVIRWLRINLGVTMFVLTLVSGGTGALISATLRIAGFDFRLDGVEHAEQEGRMRIEALESLSKEAITRRLKLGDDLAEIRGRLAIVEAQEVFVGAFLRDNLAMTPRANAARGTR